MSEDNILVFNYVGNEITDEMWEQYLAAPIPDGWEATGEVRHSQPGEVYLNPVTIWNGYPGEAITDEGFFEGYTGYRVLDGPIKSFDEKPMTRRILKRKEERDG